MATNPNHSNAAPILAPGSGGAGVAASAAPAGQSSGEMLRDCGQLLTGAVRMKGRELSRPAGRRALWPVAMALVAVGIAARDAAFSAAGPSVSFAQRPSVEHSAVAPRAAEPAEARTSLQEWLDLPVQPLTRNPFSAGGKSASAPEQKSPLNSADGIQRREDVMPPPDPGPAHPLVTRDVTDRTTRPASASGSRDEQARQVRLQSTLTGAVPTALVDGRMVREGDVVATGSGVSRTTFRVLKIEARRIILEREGIRSEIPIE